MEKKKKTELKLEKLQFNVQTWLSALYKRQLK